MAREDIKNNRMLTKKLEEIQYKFFIDLAEKCSEDDILLIAKILSHILTSSELDEKARIEKAVTVARNYLSALAKTKSLVDFPQVIGGLIIPIKQEVNQSIAQRFENEISPDHFLKSLLQRCVDECVRSVKEQDSSRIDSRFFNDVVISELNDGQKQPIGVINKAFDERSRSEELLSEIRNAFQNQGILSENERAREAIIFLLGDKQYGIEFQLLAVIADMFYKIGITNNIEPEEISVNLTSDHGSIKVEYSGSFKLFESIGSGEKTRKKTYKGDFEANINLVPEDEHFTIQMSKFEFDLRDSVLFKETKFCLLGSHVLSPNSPQKQPDNLENNSSSLKTPETQQVEKSAKREPESIEVLTQKEWKASVISNINKASKKIEENEQKLKELVESGDDIDRKLKNFEALKTAYAKFEQIRNKYRLNREQQQLPIDAHKDPLSDGINVKRTEKSDLYFENTCDEVIAQAFLYGEAHNYIFVETDELSTWQNLVELAKILLEHAEQLGKNITDGNKLADLQNRVEFLRQIRDGKLTLPQPSISFDKLLLEIRKAPSVERVTDSQLHDKAIDVLLEAKRLLEKQEWLKDSLNRYLNKNETDDIVPGHVQSLLTKLEQQRVWLEKEIKGGLNKSMSNYEEFGILIRKAYRSLEAGDISVAMSIYQQMLIVPEWQKYLKSQPKSARQVSDLYNAMVNTQAKAIKEVAAKYFLQINLDDLYAQKSDELTQFAEYFNKLPNHVRETILSKSSLHLRVIQTEYWVWVAHQCYLNGDFCSSTAIMIGLQMVLGKLLTEDNLSAQAQNRYRELKNLTAYEHNWKELRQAIDSCQHAVPLMPIYLGDLDKIKERNRLKDGDFSIKLSDSADAHEIVNKLKSKQEHLRESYIQSLSSPAAIKLKKSLYNVNELMTELGKLEQEANSIYSTVLELWNRLSDDDQPHDISELNLDNLKKKIEELEFKVNEYHLPEGNKEIRQLEKNIKDTINKTQKMLLESMCFSEFNRDRSILCREIIEHLITYQQQPDNKDNFIQLVMKTKFVTRGNKGSDDLLPDLEAYLEPHLPQIKYFAGMLLPKQITRLTVENMKNAFYELLDSLKNTARDDLIQDNPIIDEDDKDLPSIVHFLSGILAKLEHDFIPELNGLHSRVTETEKAIMDHFHELITQTLHGIDAVQPNYVKLLQLTEQSNKLKTDIKEHLNDINENNVLFNIRNDLLTRINNKYELSKIFIKPNELAADLKKLLVNPPSTIHLRNKLQQITRAKFSDQEAADIKQIAFHAMVENEKLAKILEGHTLKSRHAHSKNIFSYKSTSKCIENLNKAMRKQDLNQVNHWLKELNVDVSNDQLQKELGSMGLVASGTKNITSLVGLTAGSVAVTAATLGTGIGIAALGALATAVATGGINYLSQRKSKTPLAKFGLFADKNTPETRSEETQNTKSMEQSETQQQQLNSGYSI